MDQALSYFHDVNQQPLVETRSNRIRSVRPQTAVFRGMIGHSMVNSKILLLQRPKVSAHLFHRVCVTGVKDEHKGSEMGGIIPERI